MGKGLDPEEGQLLPLSLLDLIRDHCSAIGPKAIICSLKIGLSITQINVIGKRN